MFRKVSFLLFCLPSTLRKHLIVLGFLAFLIIAPAVLAYSSPGTANGYVNDFAGVIDATTKINLEAELQSFTQTTSHEIAVVTIKTLDGDTIENYAVDLFKEWGIGKKGVDNGILFLVSIDDRQMRIEIGYGLEGALTDLQSRSILDNIARPYFKQSDYSQGILLATQAIESTIKGEVVASTPVVPRTEGKYSGSLWETLGVIFFFILMTVWRLVFYALGKTKSFWLGGLIGGAGAFMIAWFLTGFIISALLPALIGLLAGLFMDYGASRLDWFKKKGGGKGGFWGGFGGFGGSGGGGGGFGGGSSGGGGSSSSW
ncbi:MAG: hypothetical protein UT02_C0015G0012 [Parcubacteria group bacterium GW2011_GWC2_38_7]|nr:MAG: hypothetical protein UT02_C0015G0012 [Parcubacteria group bacterium GW2011_GWC2_38_7]